METVKTNNWHLSPRGNNPEGFISFQYMGKNNLLLKWSILVSTFLYTGMPSHTHINFKDKVKPDLINTLQYWYTYVNFIYMLGLPNGLKSIYFGPHPQPHSILFYCVQEGGYKYINFFINGQKYGPVFFFF